MNTRKRVNNKQEPSISNKQAKHTIVLSEDVNQEKVEETIDQNYTENELGLSEYEKARLENIKRNEDFLLQLGVNAIKSDIENRSSALTIKKPQAAKRGATKNSKSVSNIIVGVRRSSRVTFDKLKEEVESLKETGADEESIRKKQEELDVLIAKKNEGSYEPSFNTDLPSTNTTYQRIEQQSIPVPDFINIPKDTNDIPNEWSTSLKNIFSTMTAEKSKEKRTQSNFTEYKKNILKLNIQPNHVAKLTDSRITSTFIHPCVDKTIVLAGDNGGVLGIWDVNNMTDGMEGVFKYRPHVSNITKIFCSTDSSHKIYTLSYDGTVRSIDLNQPDGLFKEFEAPESLNDMYFTDSSSIKSSPTSILVSKSNGQVSLIDFRSSNFEYSWTCELPHNKINSIQEHPVANHLIITAGGGKDGTIMIHDVRKMNKTNPTPIMNLTQHSKSINAAYCTYDGKYLVSLSQDGTIRTWANYIDSTSTLRCIVNRHNNFTGRWLSTFKPVFDPKCNNVFMVGSMEQPRRLEMFHINEENGNAFSVNLLHNFKSDALGSVCSRNSIHESRYIVAGGNSSGRVHIFT